MPAYLTDAERASLAIREHEASLPAGEVELVTLEFRHPALSEPVRVVNDRVAHQLTLEATAPANPGETVTFQRSGFQLTWPATKRDRSPEIELEAMNANAALERVLDLTMASDAAVELTVRSYLSTDLTGPAAIVEGLEIRESLATDRAVRARAGMFNWERAAGLIYTRSSHPLIGG